MRILDSRGFHEYKNLTTLTTTLKFKTHDSAALLLLMFEYAVYLQLKDCVVPHKFIIDEDN